MGGWERRAKSDDRPTWIVSEQSWSSSQNQRDKMLRVACCGGIAQPGDVLAVMAAYELPFVDQLGVPELCRLALARINQIRYGAGLPLFVYDPSVPPVVSPRSATEGRGGMANKET